MHHVDGQVFVGDQLISHHPNRFPRIAEGQILRTGQGRVEVLLGPEIVLRASSFSAIRLLPDDVSHVRIAVIEGSVIVARSAQSTASAIDVEHGAATLRIRNRGVYRFDIRPGLEHSLRVFRGQGFLISTGLDEFVREGQIAVVASGSNQIARFDPSETDALDEWNEMRSAFIGRLNKAGRRSLGRRFPGSGAFGSGGRATGAPRRWRGP